MRTYKEVTKTVTTTRLAEIRCDLCGAVASGGDWESGVYEVNDVTIEVTVHQKEGTSYPEGGSGTEYVIDLCPDCFKNRLVSWLLSQGATIQEQEWDW